MLRLLNAGESHGPALTVVVDGLPAGIPIDRRCRTEVEDAVTFAEASPWPDPGTVGDGVYAANPPGEQP